ncbi:hypothetical protein D3C71_1441560 [compost metagenome]
MTNGTERFALVSGHHTLRGVFYHPQVIFFRQRHDGVHLAGHPGVMHRHDSACLIGDSRFDFSLIDVHGIRTQIDKHHGGPAQHEGIGG